VSQFSKEVGLEKMNVLIMMLGEQNLKKIAAMTQMSLTSESASDSNPPLNLRPKSSHLDRHTKLDSVATGKAAAQAYNNLKGGPGSMSPS